MIQRMVRSGRFGQVLLGLLVILSSVVSVRAESYPRVMEATGPRAIDRMITKTVKQLVESGHIARRPFDDEISQRSFDHFIKLLDPMKLYFFQSDIDEFLAVRNQLDDRAAKGDITFAYDAFRRKMERFQAIMPVVHDLIDKDHDYTVDEQIVTDFDVATYPKDIAEQTDRWRKQIKYSMLVLRADKTEVAAEVTDPRTPTKVDPSAPETIADIRDTLHRRFRMQERTLLQMDSFELLEMYLSSLTESLDPHTNYMAPRAQDNFRIQLGLQLQGIGATLKSEDGITTIAGTVPGGPAAKDGRLKEGDRIVAVGQEGSPEMVDVVEMKLDDVVSMIRGPAGTKVRLSVKPKVGNDVTIIEITRAKVELTDSAARGEVLQRGMKADGSPYLLGYIDLPSFYFNMGQGFGNHSTSADIERILSGFKAQKVDAVVLDLSRNGGGSLEEAIHCTGLFIDNGPVVQVKGSEGRTVTHEDDERGTAWDGPLVVMTSKMSASASEIFAGAIKDYDRGIVVGDPSTHGKGTVQQLADVGEAIFGNAAQEYGALKITIQQFYLPDGQSTQLQGVTADVVLPSIIAHIEGLSESDLDYALPADRIPQRRHMSYGMVDEAIRDALRNASAQRVSASKDFDKVKRRIEKYLEQKEEKFASLNEATFMAKRAELNADREEEKEMEKLESNDEKVYDDSFYNQEVMNITLDYIQQLKQRKLAKAG